ncbi:MAG: hypothetical protein ACI4MP_01270 [Candidatus Ventricola sp.]
MRLFKRWYVQLGLFLAGFAALVCLADFVLVPLRTQELVCSYDFTHSENAQIVAIGNSLCIEQIDPYQLEYATGKHALNFGISASKAQSLVAMATEAFTVHRPEVLLVVYDPEWDIALKEDTVVMAKLSPLLSTLENRMRYLLDRMECSIDDLNRVFLWRMGMECSPGQIAERVQYKLGINQKAIYEKRLDKINRENKMYRGRGYYVIQGEHDVASLKRSSHRVSAEKEKPLDDRVAGFLKRVKALCDQNDCKMVVVTTPMMRDNVLSDGRARSSMEAMKAFGREEGIAYLNFTYAQGKSMPDLTGHYRDGYNHLDAEGLELFNASFAQTMKAFLDGEDVMDRLMTEEEWLASIDRVTDVWMTRKERGSQRVYTAHALCGTKVSCEYRFALVDADGNETILQDYAKSREVRVEQASRADAVKVYVRNGANPEQPALSCVYE